MMKQSLRDLFKLEATYQLQAAIFYKDDNFYSVFKA